MDMKINLYGQTLFTVKDSELSIDNIQRKLVNEFGEIIYNDKEHTILNIDFTGVITPIRKISIDENDRIVSLYKSCSPKLVEYFSKHISEVIDYDKKGFVDVTISKLNSLLLNGKNNVFNDEITKALNSPICPICGRHIDRGLLEDYRGNIVTSNYIDCPDCQHCDNKFHRKLKSLTDKFSKYKCFFKAQNVVLSVKEVL